MTWPLALLLGVLSIGLCLASFLLGFIMGFAKGYLEQTKEQTKKDELASASDAIEHLWNESGMQ